MAMFGKMYVAVGALCLASSIIGAQAAPAKAACDVEEAAKGNAARATLMVGLARNAAVPSVAATNLKQAVKLLETLDKGDDPVVDAYVLGEAISLWAGQPGVGLTPTRASLGFALRPTETVDIPSTIDSLFTIVEAAKPACKEYASYWRAGQKFYLDIVNNAINALNAEKLDSAEYYATQANKLFSSSPYGTMVLGSVASKKGNNAKAIEYWTLSAEAANRDSAYRDVRRQMFVNIGSAYLSEANAASGAAKVAPARKAAEAYGSLIAVPGTRGQFMSAGRQNMQNALLIAGDTAGAAKTWEPLIANPSTFEYQDLLNSAVSASRAMKSQDAVKLFEAALAQNPNSRDALFNLAITYLTLEENEKVGPIVTRLVVLDPGNPENYNLAARAYLTLAKNAEKAKKPAMAAALNDTTLSWYNQGNKLPVEVTFNEFSPSDKQVTISGSITDRRDKSDANSTDAAPAAGAAPAAKGAKGKAPAKAPVKAPEPKTYPPKAVTLTFEALDKAGAVVGTKTVTSESLSPGARAKFTLTIPGGGAVAYRYKISD
ncbi:MAG: FxLYD domain-containing protein [bacterium]